MTPEPDPVLRTHLVVIMPRGGGAVKGFVLDGAEVAEGGVPAPGVVPSLDPLDHR